MGLALDTIRGSRPTTVLSLLARRTDPVDIEAIAGNIGKPLEEVEWTVEVLEDAELCARFVQDGITKVIATTPHITAQR